MNPCVFIIFSLLLLLLVTTNASQLVAVGGDDTNVVVKKCLDEERDALLLFKAPVQDPFNYLSTWRADEDDCCKWSGVTCSNQTGHVTELHISEYGLEGEISSSLHNLSYLNVLDLSFNSFHGTIPLFIGSMTRLRYLNIGHNNLNGSIPTFMGSMTRLRHLDLSDSKLNGTIPKSISSLTKLSYLNLRLNNLNGSIPRSIGSLTELRYLDLSINSLYGTIPPEFGNLTNLQVLGLGYVGRCRVEKLEWLTHLSHLEVLQLDGISLAKQNHWVDVILNLPKLSYLSLDGCELSQVMHPYSSFLNSSSSIHALDLSYNMLDGIPKYLGNLCSLRYLDFHYNSAVVKFPDFLNNLSSGCTPLSLQVLYASGNQLTGSLSDDIQKYSSLVHLDLSRNQLNGSISEKLWELPSLQSLDISFNNNLRVPSTYHLSNHSYVVNELYLRSCKVGPPFPKWIQSLKNLTVLDLSNNSISDTIPLEFWNMWPYQLQYLDLSSNNISGKLPDLSSNFANESEIHLSSNSFYGPIPKVSSALASLDLSRNNFSGGISFICQIVDGFLSFLDLSHNSFIGQLPDCLWHFKQLQLLNLEHNNLFGRLPPAIGSIKNCTGLKSFNLGANKFSGNVPVWIGKNLLGLNVLILRSNNFFGTIPSELCQLASLQILDLSMNNLNGTIPSCFSNLTSMIQQGLSQDAQFYTHHFDREYVGHAMIEWQGAEREFFSTLKLVKSIDLSTNNLTGQIPYEITNLHDLIALNLSRNALFGEIPWNIGGMKTLLTLDLSRNNISGQIPSSMSQMSLLNCLDLSFNKLSERIPSSTQLQSFQPSRYDGNAGLCGLPLPKKCPGDEESKATLVVGKSEGDGEDKDEVWGWFYIGVGTGFVTGFWIACGALLLNRRGRHAFFHFYDSFKDLVYVKVVVFIASLQKARQA